MTSSFSSDPPDKPSSVTISVASEDSLLVRFIEPLNEKVIVSKYKSEYEKLISNCIFLNLISHCNIAELRQPEEPPSGVP